MIFYVDEGEALVLIKYDRTVGKNHESIWMDKGPKNLQHYRENKSNPYVTATLVTCSDDCDSS